MGYGTGLNAYLSYLESQKLLSKIYYTSLELFPLTIKEIECLNYDEFFTSKNEVLTFENFSKIEWGLKKYIFNLLWVTVVYL